MKLDQSRAPIYEALENFRKMRVVPFDVPGHKRGRGNPELAALLGEKCVDMDVNSMKPLDNLCHPVSVIREAEQLAADAFGAAHAFLMVGGTTSAVQSMVLSVAKRGEKIILPRNVHRSVMGAMVLCGAVPVYVNPECDDRLGIPLGMKLSRWRRPSVENPDAKAILVNNPTYYGICSDLKAIVELAHRHGMLCLADEAHGTHFYFGEDMPISAMAAGADMAAVSMHKSGRQPDPELPAADGPAMHEGYVRQIINLTQTTSASYLLLSSLDISRRNLALRGKEAFAGVVEMADYARQEINNIGGYYAYSRELINGDSVYRLRRDQAVGQHAGYRPGRHRGVRPAARRIRHSDRVRRPGQHPGLPLHRRPAAGRRAAGERALRGAPPLCRKDKAGLMKQEYIDPEVAVSPQEAFYADKESLPLRRPRAASAASLSCATRRASPFWPRASGSPAPF